MSLVPEVKAEWLKELRSGNYAQGSGYLRLSNGEFCCLGILCEIAVKQGVIPEPEVRGEHYLNGPDDSVRPFQYQGSGMGGNGGRYFGIGNPGLLIPDE
jgi:hypothetical protein